MNTTVSLKRSYLDLKPICLNKRGLDYSMSESNHKRIPLYISNPELVKEWDFEKNSPLTPQSITAGSGKKVWWKCAKGHEWQAMVSNRNKGRGCPFCSGQRIVVGKTDLASVNPDLVSEWDYEKNGKLLPDSVAPFSNVRVWWKCSKGHEWKTSINARSNGTKCPYCSGNKLMPGFNDLLSCNPELAKEWNYDKNNGLGPADFMFGSNKKVWWKCSEGHEWLASISNRKKDRGCPYCSNRMVLEGYNDLQTVNPALASEWDCEKNGKLSPQMVTTHSGKKVWWICAKNHSWQASIDNRSKGKGCPVCKNKKVSIGHNNLSLTNPELIMEWDYDKNVGLSPDDFTVGSYKRVWWKCKNGHSWYVSIYHRNKSQGCPYCSNSKVKSGFNDLATANPIIASEWDYEKNGELTPNDFLPNSGKKAWWKCARGHSWNATIVSRNYGGGCPQCSSEMKTSFPEQACLFYFEKITRAINRDITWGKEIDVYLPDKQAGIEYDGRYYHKTDKSKKNEMLKDAFFADNNIRIIRIKESNDNRTDGNIIQYKVDYKYSYLPWAIMEACQLLGIEECPDMDLDRDQAEIYSRYVNSMKASSLAEKRPDLASEWDYEKNGMLTPDLVSFSSMKIVWWKCKQNHSWSASVNGRNKAGCPFCSGKRAIKGETDFATLFPALVGEWNYEKNGELLPDSVTAHSSKKVWWKCAQGHEWEATINTRSYGSECPICLNRRQQSRYGDLQSSNPLLASEWNYEKNGNLKPSDFTLHSGKKVWWKCAKGHEWEATIDNRAGRGIGCPFCQGKKPVRGINDLATTNPSLVKEWNYEKNIDLTPSNLTSGSGRKVWWKCSKGHEWQAVVSNRTRNGYGCPYCAGHLLIPGVNDLLSVNPQLATEWNVEKNGGKTPSEFMPNSNKKVWWKCVNGHEWEATINHRSSGRNCPYCARKEKGKARAKKVRCIETGIVYSSTKEAAMLTNNYQSTISLCCRGKQQTTGGCHWEYIE